MISDVCTDLLAIIKQMNDSEYFQWLWNILFSIRRVLSIRWGIFTYRELIDASVNVNLTVLLSFSLLTLINKLCKYPPSLQLWPSLSISLPHFTRTMKFACLHPTTSEKYINGDEMDSYIFSFVPQSVIESGRRRMGGGKWITIEWKSKINSQMIVAKVERRSLSRTFSRATKARKLRWSV